MPIVAFAESSSRVCDHVRTSRHLPQPPAHVADWVIGFHWPQAKEGEWSRITDSCAYEELVDLIWLTGPIPIPNHQARLSAGQVRRYLKWSWAAPPYRPREQSRARAGPDGTLFWVHTAPTCSPHSLREPAWFACRVALVSQDLGS